MTQSFRAKQNIHDDEMARKRSTKIRVVSNRDSDGLAQNLGNSGADRCCRGLTQRLSCMILCVERVCMILVCLSVSFIIQSDNSSSS